MSVHLSPVFCWFGPSPLIPRFGTCPFALAKAASRVPGSCWMVGCHHPSFGRLANICIYIYIQRSNLLWFLFVDWSCINWKLKLGWYVTLKDRRIAAASWNESINANLQAMDFCLIGTSSESSWAVGLMYFSTTAATGVCGKWCFWPLQLCIRHVLPPNGFLQCYRRPLVGGSWL